MEASSQFHSPAVLPPEKIPRHTLRRLLDGPQSWSGRGGTEKILDTTGTQNSDHSVVQPVDSRYTDCAIPALLVGKTFEISHKYN
jgi:hypothetical protein